MREPETPPTRRIGVRLRLLVLVAVVVLAGCEPASDAACREPPASEVSQRSALAMDLAPNPVEAGSDATLSLGRDGLGQAAVTGAGAAWQCWTDDGWLDTHQIVKGFGGSGAQTIAVSPVATTTIPAVGLPIPNAYPILVPEVPAGTYRIADDAYDGGSTIPGFVVVEVTTGS